MQTAGVPVSWVNTTVLPANSSGGGGGGGAGGSTPQVSAGGRRHLLQGAGGSNAPQDITISSDISTGQPAQVQQAFTNAQTNGQLTQQLQAAGFTLVPDSPSPFPPVRS